MYSPDQADGSDPDPDNSLSQTAQLLATERSAKRIICQLDPRYRMLSKAERRALLVGFAMCGKALSGAAYDAVRLEREVDLSDPEAIARSIDAIVLIEVKSTNRPSIGESLAGYFFNITSAELLVAQSLGNQYRFAFVNTVTGHCQELTLSEVLTKAKTIYPAFHIKL